MSDFDKWFFNTGGDCYGSNSEEYKISKVTWDYQQKKIDELDKLYKEAVRCLMESNYNDEKYLKRRGAIK